MIDFKNALLVNQRIAHNSLCQIRGSSSTIQEWQYVNNSRVTSEDNEPSKKETQTSMCLFLKYTGQAHQKPVEISVKKMKLFCIKSWLILAIQGVQSWADSPVIILSQIHKEWPSL